MARDAAMNATLLTLFHIHFPKEVSGNKKEICWFQFSLVDLIFIEPILIVLWHDYIIIDDTSNFISKIMKQ